MDAVEFLKGRARMCNYYMNTCINCPGNKVEYCATLCANAIDLVPIVEQWAKEHPVKTRQSELLKLFPNTKIDNAGTLCICPMNFDPETYKSEDKCFCIHNYDDIQCKDCRRDFWLTEIKDGET